MKLLIQCVDRASVRVEDEIVGQIGRGALIFVGVEQGDDDTICDRMIAKAAKLRVFSMITARPT